MVRPALEAMGGKIVFAGVTANPAEPAAQGHARLRGDEHVLDVGCGRGAVLMLAARRLPAGRAVEADV